MDHSTATGAPAGTVKQARPDTGPYSPFLAELRRAIRNPVDLDPLPLLNGRAGQMCIELLKPATQRSLGAFFTPSAMAARFAAEVSEFDPSYSVAFDPACGAGDLLLHLAAQLPIARTASQTMNLWSSRLLGRDLSREFVSAARLRLLLLAVARGAQLDGAPSVLASKLRGIKVGDGLNVVKPYRLATHVVMNPPFGVVSAPDNSKGRRGSTTAAALFVDRAVVLCRPGTRVAAIVPEVLRTGTSYQIWRDYISSRTRSNCTRSLGRFSSHADVDVTLKLWTVTEETNRLCAKRKESRITRPCVGDKFAVTVGPVVPHRHAENGKEHAFLHTRNAAAWRHIRRINERRHFEGRLCKPPFVVIRRTSRPGDRFRATASLVLGARPIAVENHLLVATPRRGGVSICTRLLRLLRTEAVNRALDRSMRCRHLTTASVLELAWL